MDVASSIFDELLQGARSYDQSESMVLHVSPNVRVGDTTGVRGFIKDVVNVWKYGAARMRMEGNAGVPNISCTWPVHTCGTPG